MIHIQHEISLLLSHAFENNEIFDQILEKICEIEGIDSGGLYLYNDDETLSLISHIGLKKEFIDKVSFYQKNSINSEIVTNGKPIYNQISKNLFSENIKSSAIIPIHHNNKPIACLNLSSHTCDEIPSNVKITIESIALNLGGAIARIKSEKLLKESEQNFISLFNSIEDLIFILDENGKILETNENVKKRLGYTENEIKKMNAIDFHPIDRREEASIIIKKMSNGKQDNCQIPLICKDGTYIHVETRVVKGIWNKREALFGISRDISNDLYSLRQQTLLADISQKLNSVYNLEENIYDTLRIIGEHTDVSRVYIFEDDFVKKTTSNTYEWCNKGISQQKYNLQDLPLDMIKSMNLLYFQNNGMFLSNDIHKLPEDLIEIFESQDIKSILIFPLSDEQKNVFGFIGFDECNRSREWEKDEIELLRTLSHILSSTFKRLKIQKELDNSKYFAENLMKTANVMIVGLDTIGNVTIFNKAAENLTKYKKEEVIGKNWFSELKIISKNDASELKDLFSILLVEEKIHNIHENTIITKDGEIKYILWQNNENRENGVTTGIISFGLDISERRKFEEDLIEAKNRAEKSDQMKLEFLANMSHDLRTPMNSIIGFSDLLKSNNLTKHEKNDYINTIINNGKFLMALIDDIIDISKIDAGNLKIEENDFELNKLMEELRLSYSKQIKDKQIEIIIDVDVNKNVIIHTDKFRLRQILINLIGNAIKFTNEGYVKFGYKILSHKQLEIYVEDTGPGIERQYQRVIFERFKQINTSNKFKGAGLGLSITKSLVELLGFKEVKLISELEKGSKFYFNVPYTVKHYNYINEIKDKKKNKKMNFTGKNIIIVEDSREIMFIMKRYLIPTNANVIEMTDGDDLIETIKNKHIDLILLDIGLPGKDGYQLLKEIREIDDRLPVIIESALVMPDQKSKAFELGCDDFITKPFNMEDFLNKIDNLI